MRPPPDRRSILHQPKRPTQSHRPTRTDPQHTPQGVTYDGVGVRVGGDPPDTPEVAGQTFFHTTTTSTTDLKRIARDLATTAQTSEWIHIIATCDSTGYGFSAAKPAAGGALLMGAGVQLVRDVQGASSWLGHIEISTNRSGDHPDTVPVDTHSDLSCLNDTSG